jgi:nucleotide-binding universal stress UspA family protein
MNERMRILIAYDGSSCSEQMLDDLGRAGLPPEADAVVLSVGEVFLPPPPSSYEVVEQAMPPRVAAAAAHSLEHASQVMRQARELAETAAGRIGARFPAWQLRAEAADGTPAWEIITRADRWPADLVVVGSHGRSAVGRLILGSVSRKVTTEASCSVRVARCPVEKSDALPRIVVGVDGTPSSPAAAISWSRALREEMTAISDMAKTPLATSSRTMKRTSMTTALITSLLATGPDSSRATKYTCTSRQL